MDFNLRPFQLVADSKWSECESRNGCFGLFDEMGTGKTRTALYHIYNDRHEGDTLVVCPASIRAQWRRQADRFGLDLFVVSYAELARRSKTYAEVMGRRWHRILLDEAHYLGQYKTDRQGNFVGSGRANACRAVRATFRNAITGTPCFSSSRSYHAIASFLHCTVHELPQCSIRRRVSELSSIAANFPVIHATEHDIADKRYVELHGKAVDKYMENTLGVLTDNSTDAEISAWNRRASMHRRLAKEKGSLSLGLLRPDSDASIAAHDQPKVELMCRLVGERDRHNILIFTTFKTENNLIVKTLRQRFAHRSVSSITGDTTLDMRDRILKSASSVGHYKEGGTKAMHVFATECLCQTRSFDGLATIRPVFTFVCSYLEPVGSIVVAQIDTIAVGLNLNWAHTAIFPRPGWCLRQEHQAVCRLRRMSNHINHAIKEVHFLYIGRDYGQDNDDNDQSKANTFVDAHITKGRTMKKRDAEQTLGEDDCSPWIVLNQVTWHNAEFASL